MRKLVDSPMDLSDFLEKYGEHLKHVRAFYILEPLLEKGKTIKFGVAGISTGNAYNRFNEYAIIYGKRTKSNNCKGVIVHYVGITEYDRHVQPQQSQVFLIEKHLKEKYKSVTEQGRGSERVPKSTLQEIMRDLRAMKFKDVVTTLRDTNRKTTKIYQADRNAFIDSKRKPLTRSQKQ